MVPVELAAGADVDEPAHRAVSGLPPLRKGQPAPPALVERRAAIAAGRKDPVPDPGVQVVETKRGGIACVECVAQNAQRTIIHFHGGGYRLGDARGWTAWGITLAKRTQSHVVIPEYRLAPEHPFPAAIHDAVAVYGDLAEHGTEDLIVAGDSAGGGLAAALAVACKQLGRPQAAALIMISPWLDMTVTAETFTTKGECDKLFSRAHALDGSSQYLQGWDAKDPLASPLFAELSGFPPIQIFAGGAEVLLGDSTAFAKRAGEAGLTVEAHFVANMQHVWPTIFPELVETEAALVAMERFARRHARQGA